MSKTNMLPNAWVINVSQDIANCMAHKVSIPNLATALVGWNTKKPIYVKNIDGTNSIRISQKYVRNASKLVSANDRYYIAVTKRLSTPTGAVVVEACKDNTIVMSGI